MYTMDFLSEINNAVGYVGCYLDLSNERLLSGQVARGFENVQECAIYCTGYQYFGVEVPYVLLASF